MSARGYAQTGQITCHDTTGREIPCRGSGQDAEFKNGALWPTPRFEPGRETVLDRLTGLTWTRDANVCEFAMTWREALDHAASMNRERVFGFSDWRLPNRREPRSLMSHQTRKPALPEGHPFANVFSSWYWTSTTAAIHTSYAWYVHMEGARMLVAGGLQHARPCTTCRAPVHGRPGGLLVVDDEHVRARLGVGTVPCQGRRRRGAEERAALLGMGRARCCSRGAGSGVNRFEAGGRAADGVNLPAAAIRRRAGSEQRGRDSRPGASTRNCTRRGYPGLAGGTVEPRRR